MGIIEHGLTSTLNSNIIFNILGRSRRLGLSKNRQAHLVGNQFHPMTTFINAVRGPGMLQIGEAHCSGQNAE